MKHEHGLVRVEVLDGLAPVDAAERQIPVKREQRRLVRGALAQAHDSRRLAGVEQAVGQLSDRRRRQETTGRRVAAQSLADAHEQARGEPRVAAKREEVVVNADRRDPEQVFPDRGQFDLERAPRRLKWRGRRPVRSRSGHGGG
jgi:hypothetical protein